jgi:Glycosyltransferase
MEKYKHYNIEKLQLKNTYIYGYGWFLDENYKTKKIELIQEDERGKLESLICWHGKLRVDVRDCFPNIDHSKNSGFVIYAYKITSLKSLKLIITLDNEEFVEIPIDISKDKRSHIKALAVLKKAFRYCAAGKWEVLCKKSWEYLQEIIKQQNTIGDAKTTLSLNIKITLVIDHNMGGGANAYRDRLIANMLTEGKSVLLLYNDLASLDFKLKFLRSGNTSIYNIESIGEIEDYFSQGLIEEVFFNNIVSYSDPLSVVEKLAFFKTKYNFRLIFAVHDFYSICPAWVLLDCHGDFCDIPSVEICSKCLPKHQIDFLYFFRERDIELWRKVWRELLLAANEILCFSDSSKQLIRKAYPAITEEVLRIIPHKVDYMPQQLPIINFGQPMHIGIVGNISVPKGAKIVAELADIILVQKLAIKITVIGSIEIDCDSKVVSTTGPYRKEELARIIENIGVNMMFFPSVWPETFSYVTEELMQLQVPIVAFDIGAPAERMRYYNKGRIVPRIQAKDVLKQLIDFYEELKNKAG